MMYQLKFIVLLGLLICNINCNCVDNVITKGSFSIVDDFPYSGTWKLAPCVPDVYIQSKCYWPGYVRLFNFNSTCELSFDKIHTPLYYTGNNRYKWVVVSTKTLSVAVFTFVCADMNTEYILVNKKYVKYGNSNHFTFTLNTKCPVKHGYSFGCIFIILLFVIPSLYILISIINNYRHGLTGLDLIPHKEVIADAPSVIADGFYIAYHKIEGLTSRNKYQPA